MAENKRYIEIAEKKCVTLTENKEKCCGCGACAQKCATGAIKMMADAEGFLYPQIDPLRCVGCEICLSSCPANHADESIENLREAYAFQTSNAEALMRSTSGGAAYELAAEVICKGGVVFGAAYGKGFHIEHQCIRSIETLGKIQGSKYVQSEIGNTYQEAKALLRNGTIVLYTGTPCQIEGLLSYLDKTYSNLVTLDIICHGVPSPELWQKYLHSHGWDKTAKDIIFREKTNGWELGNRFFVRAKRNWSRNGEADYFMAFFYQNLSLRKICFSCPFKTGNKKADLTCADLWGIQEILQERNDDKGTSLVIVNTDKGKQLFEAIRGKHYSEGIDYDKAVAHNQMMIKSVKVNAENREAFYRDNLSMSCKQLYRKYVPQDPPILKIKKKLYPIRKLLANMLDKK